MVDAQLPLVWQPYDPRDFPEGSVLPTAAATSPATAGASASGDDDFDDPQALLLNQNPAQAQANAQMATRGQRPAPADSPVPFIPCHSTALSDAVLCAVCAVCFIWIAYATAPRNHLALVSYAILGAASGFGALKFAGRGGDSVWRWHPAAATYYRTVGLPCIGLAYSGVVFPLNLLLQFSLFAALTAVHVVSGRYGGKPAQTVAALLPLPAVWFVLYTAVWWSLWWAVAGVALFVLSALVMRPAQRSGGRSSGATAAQAAADSDGTTDHDGNPHAHTHSHLYMRLMVFGIGYRPPVLRVDVFHYVLAAAVFALAVPLATQTQAMRSAL